VVRAATVAAPAAGMGAAAAPAGDEKGKAISAARIKARIKYPQAFPQIPSPACIWKSI